MVAFKARAVDDGSGAVAGTLEIGGRRMETPGRVLTAGEVRSAKTSGHHAQMESDLFVIGRLMSQDLADAAAKEEEAWNRFAAGVTQAAKLLPKAARTLFLAQSGVTLDGIEALRSFLDLQALLGFEVITIQYGSSPSAEDVVRAWDYARRWAERRGVDTDLMPVVAPGEERDATGALLRTLVERGAKALAIDLQRGFPYQTLRAVESLKEQHPEVWVHAFQVPPRVRMGGAKLATAEAMVLPYFGIDTYSRHVVPPPPVPVKKEKINRFDPSGWGYLKWGEHAEAYGKALHCACPVCKGKDLEGFFEPSERQILDLTKVHDHFAQAAEMAKAAERIGGEGYASTMAKKRYAKEFLARMGEGSKET